MELAVGIAALVVALASVGVAFWQGSISREQLRLARDTEQRTERALDDIRKATAETRQITQDVKNSIDSQITKILDSKIAAETSSQGMGQEFLKAMLSGIKPSEPPKS